MRSRAGILLAWLAAAVAIIAGPAAALATGRPATTTPTTTTPTTTTSTSTTPSTTDSASDRAALTDYHTYLVALVKNAQTGVQRDAALTAKIRRRCSGALSPLTSLPKGHVNSAALSDLGEEIGGDLAIEFLSEADKPFAQLSSALDALPWTEVAPPEAIQGLLSSESSVLGLGISSLCVDARALAAHPRVVPAGSQSFLGTYLNDSATLKQDLSVFLSVLSHDATAHQNQLIGAIDQLVAKFASISAQAERLDAASILSALGLST